MESKGRALLRNLTSGLSEKSQKFMQVLSETFQEVEKTVDEKYEEQLKNFSKLHALCRTIQEEIGRHGDLQTSIVDPLTNVSSKLDEFYAEVEERGDPNLEKMKQAGVLYKNVTLEIASKVDTFYQRKKELFQIVEQDLIQMELLRPTIAARDTALEEYDAARASVKTLMDKNHATDRLQKAQANLEARTAKYNTLNAGIIAEVSALYSKSYSHLKEEYNTLLDYQIDLFNMIEQCYKHLGEAMNMDTEPIQKQIREKAAHLSSNRTSSKKAQAALEELKHHEGKKTPSPAPSVLPAQALEQKLDQEDSFAKRAVKQVNRKRVDSQPETFTRTSSDEYEGRVVPLCKICKKEVPIEFINEHSSVCSAANNEEAELIEEALWVDHIEGLEMYKFAPVRRKYGPIKKLMRTIGVPDKLRATIWPLIVNITLRKNNKDNPSYDTLYTESVGKTTSWTEQIERDLLRTFPHDELYQREERLTAMRNVLTAYAHYNQSIGYCQSMNFIVAILLNHLSEEDAFWTLVIIIEDTLPANYYTKTMAGIQVDQLSFKHLLSYYLPKVSNHLKKLDVDIQPIIVRWFLCLFVSVFPLDGADRLLELFLYEGDIMLFRYGLAIFKMHEKAIMEVDGMTEMFNLLQNVTKITHFKKLIHVAYQFDLKGSQVKGIRKRFLKEVNDEEQQRIQKKLLKEQQATRNT